MGIYMKKVSIVTAYHNRKQQFINTLNSILIQKYDCELEIIVVDDGSNDEHRLYDINDLFPTLDIKLLNITKEEKWWVNTCIPYNKGFAMATGDVIIIQDAECLHMGNIIQAAIDNIEKNKYLVFGCYMINITETNAINNLEFNDKYINNIVDIITPIKNRCAFNGSDSAWYQHSKYRPEALHFCTAITKEDLEELGGFDERFANGFAKEDRELIMRIKRKRMSIVMFDNLIVLHQQHDPSKYFPDITRINRELYQKAMTENIIKANE